jgi:ABC-type multidrug transport system fused ATPase/permease subunit
MSSESKINDINDYFKIPIYYNDKKVELNKNIIKDLELIETVDTSCNSIYHHCFDNDNDVSEKLNQQICRFYTTDVEFLKDNQKLLKEYKPLGVKYTDYSKNYKNIVDIWNELKIDNGFKERYYFVEWEVLDFLNRSELFLQFMSIYNLLSPVISLLVPIIILIIPFFIIKMKGLNISINEYIDVLKIVANQNAIGKLFVVNFNEINPQEKLYIFISAAFYLFSIYQNFMVCVRFNKNMRTIHNHFNEIRIYIEHTINSMENYLKYSSNLSSHEEFNKLIGVKLIILKNIQDKIKTISDYNMFNFSKIKEIGYVFKCFYELHTDKIYDDAIMYSLGFNGYMDCLKGLQNNILERKMNYALFIEESKKTVFENSYYASLKNSNPIKNTIKLKKNMIITGPNASGKTTILKSTLINILFTQQFGCGFYDSAKVKPFNHIHCYLNIPDTSGRDSLFQAEARRCKEILDAISINKKETHFCAFDELYSGTNPEEAEQSATSFMKYITKYQNVSCLLTTHFIKICKKLSKSKTVTNYKMLTEYNDNQLIYKYTLEEGISNIKGGIMVLKQMNYPKEIIDNTAL